MKKTWLALASLLMSLSACGDEKSATEQTQSKAIAPRLSSSEICLGPGYCVHYQNGQYVYGYYVSCVGTLQDNGQCRVN